MYRNILVPVALDHERDIAAALAIAQALVVKGGTITALTVVEAVPAYIMAGFPENQAENNRAAALEALKEELAGTDAKPVVVTGHAARSILDYAESHEVDCIVIASHRPGLQDFFLGSTAARVVRHAQCAVHVVR